MNALDWFTKETEKTKAEIKALMIENEQLRKGLTQEQLELLNKLMSEQQ